MFPNLFGVTSRFMHQILCSRSFHALPPTISNTVVPTIPEHNSWSFNSVRTNIRNNFPRPREGKRIKVHGWRALLSTKRGRRTIMRRILKGRYYLTH